MRALNLTSSDVSMHRFLQENKPQLLSAVGMFGYVSTSKSWPKNNDLRIINSQYANELHTVEKKRAGGTE